MTNALERQVGGGHYKSMGMQPIEFAMTNQWDAAAFSVLKYLSRHRNKNGVEDLKKARHFIELRVELGRLRFAAIERVPMSRYISLNNISGLDAAALMWLESWVVEPTEERDLGDVMRCIDLMIAEYGGDSQLSLLR